MQHFVSIAAATAVVGYDLISDADWQQQPYARRIAAIAVTGSAAAADTEIEIFIGPVRIGVMKNTNTGYPTDDDFVGCNELVPAGAKIQAKVVDAPASNPIVVLMAVSP